MSLNLVAAVTAGVVVLPGTTRKENPYAPISVNAKNRNVRFRFRSKVDSHSIAPSEHLVVIGPDFDIGTVGRARVAHLRHWIGGLGGGGSGGGGGKDR